MKCPLPNIVYEQDSFPPHESYRNCLQAECAWWDERKGVCGERTKRLQLERIADALKDLAGKMPLGGMK